MQRQFELAHSFFEFVDECPRRVLKAGNGVVRAANDDHPSGCQFGEADRMPPPWQSQWRRHRWSATLPQKRGL
jgi:hypothetical protein